jgi:cystathionine beta-synthase
VHGLGVCRSISEAVGETPLLRLGPAVAGLPCEAFAKLEFLNPMGSVKDRIARYLVERALADGRLAPGGVIVEASSGNTAMGLAMMAARHGLRCKMVVRRQTSREKLASLRALGVELVLVDGALPPEHPESYNRKARQVAAETPGAFFPDQHNNRENSEAHYRTTGPELWRQMEGRIDVFVAGIGTGGTISGVARFLKEQDPRVRVVAVDVEGSVFSDHFRGGPPGRPRPYLLEGLGDEEVIACPEFERIDDMLQVSDREAFLAARDLARSEGVFAGGSSGAALWGVRQVAAGLDRPARIATLFPDHGSRYLSTLYDDDWMRGKGFIE